MTNIWKQKDSLLRDIIVRVSVTLMIAIVMAITYPVYEYFNVPAKIYKMGLIIAGFVIIWLVISKIESRA